MKSGSNICVFFLVPVLIALLAGCVSGSAGSARFLTESNIEKQEIVGYLRQPKGSGPHPAVILLHGCGGLELEQRGSYVWRGLNQHADALIAAGFATFIVDSWGPRGETFTQLMRSGCRQGRVSTRVNDLFGALNYLDTLPQIDASRVGAVGLSEGGTAVLRALETDHYRTRTNLLRGSVAIYPECSKTGPPYYAPALILIGDADDITYYGSCENTMYMADITKDGSQFSGDMPIVLPKLKVYPGVHHSFDLPIPGLNKIPIGTVAPDRAATEDARARMVLFFKQHL